MKNKLRGEQGYTLLLWVLMFLVIGMLMTTFMLQYTMVNLKATQVCEAVMYRQYAADGGVERAIYQIRAGELGHFEDELNNCDVSVDIETVMTYKKFLGYIADEKPGHQFHARHPHDDDSDLDVKKDVSGNVVTIDVLNQSTDKGKASEPIQSVVFWVLGEYEFVQNLAGLGSQPEVIGKLSGTSFIWREDNLKGISLKPGELVSFSFEISPVVETDLHIAMVRRSGDVWLVPDGQYEPLEVYRITSAAEDKDGKVETIESVVMRYGEHVRVLTFQYK